MGVALKKDFGQIKEVLGRSMRLRCPACGESKIVTHPFHIRHHCPNCFALFKREDGFFVGAILANVVTTELVILVVCFFFLLIVGAQYQSVLALLFVMAYRNQFHTGHGCLAPTPAASSARCFAKHGLLCQKARVWNGTAAASRSTT